MQSLADAERVAEGTLSSGEDDPDISTVSWDDDDGSFNMDANMFTFPEPENSEEDSNSRSSTPSGFPVDGVSLSGSSGGDPDVPTAVDGSPASTEFDINAVTVSSCEDGSSSSSHTAVGSGAEADERLSAEAVDPPTHQALTSLVRRLRLTVRRFEPPAMLSALRSLEALSQSGAHYGTRRSGSCC